MKHRVAITSTSRDIFKDQFSGMLPYELRTIQAQVLYAGVGLNSEANSSLSFEHTLLNGLVRSS